jgi:hypothetical protein
MAQRKTLTEQQVSLLRWIAEDCPEAGATYRALWEQGTLEQPMVDLALAEAFEQRREENSAVVKRLVLFLALGSLVLETAGLAVAAALTS